MAGGRPRKVDQGLPPRVYLKSGTFYYVHRDNRWQGLGKDLAKASALAASFSAAVPAAGTMSYWLKTWIIELDARVKAGDLAPRTRADYSDAVDKLTLFFGKMDPGSVQPMHVGEYLDLGRELDRSVRANREKAALSSCYSWLIRTGIVASNPCKGIKRNRETKRDRWISDAEYHAVYDLAGPAVRVWMVLIYRTLQRPSDILAWTQDSIVKRDGQRLLEFRQGKTGRLMSIILDAEIETALAAVASARGGARRPLVPTEAGAHYTETGLASMFRRHVVAAKVTDFAPYDLKAKGATDMYKDGVPLETICALCGHESVKTTEVYIKTHMRESIAANKRVLKRPVASTVRT